MREEPCGIANGVTLEDTSSGKTAPQQEVLQLQASSAMFLEPIQKNTHLFHLPRVQALQYMKMKN